MKQLVLISTLLALGGCAATYKEPTLPADHPANAAAADAPAMPHSRTLDLAGAEPLAPETASPGMGRAGHGMEERSAESPAPSGTDGSAHKYDGPAPTSGVAVALYACPMHPEVTSDKPNERCPKCGMRLKKQDGGKQP